MAKIIKRGKEYYVQFYGNGLLFEKYAGKNKEEARRILKDIENSLPDGAMSCVIFDQVVDFFLDEYLGYSLSKNTLLTHQQFVKVVCELKRFINQELPNIKKLSQLTPKVIQDFCDFLNITKNDPLEVNFILFLASTLMDYAVNRGYINDNPFLHVRMMYQQGILSQSVGDIGELENRLSGFNDQEKVIYAYLLGERNDVQRIKKIKWVDIKDKTLREAYIYRLIKRGVSLFKIYEILGPDDIGWLKPFVGVSNTNIIDEIDSA